jgi:hypothetical protein
MSSGMSTVDALRKVLMSGLVAGLLAVPAWTHAQQPLDEETLSPEPHGLMAQDSEQNRRDAEQEERDREQAKRDREQERKDREQEKLDRMQELYDDAREALDDDKYQQA